MARSKKLQFCDALLKSTCILALGFLSTAALTGCLVAGGGFSSSGGWFLWPGGLAGLFMILLILFLLRRRR
jgi:hypothetical protein